MANEGGNSGQCQIDYDRFRSIVKSPILATHFWLHSFGDKNAYKLWLRLSQVRNFPGYSCLHILCNSNVFYHYMQINNFIAKLVQCFGNCCKTSVNLIVKIFFIHSHSCSLDIFQVYLYIYNLTWLMLICQYLIMDNI